MSDSSARRVTDRRGATGQIEGDLSSATGQEGSVDVRLDDRGGGTGGEALLALPSELLSEEGEGGYRFEGVFEELLEAAPRGEGETVETQTVPLVEEELSVRKRKRETARVRIRKRVHERTETVDEPLNRHEVEVERVAVDEVIDEPVATRQEGDTMIIPVMEERLVVHRELVLREELHVTQRDTTYHEPQEVVLRREEAEVERVPLSEDEAGEASSSGPAASS